MHLRALPLLLFVWFGFFSVFTQASAESACASLAHTTFPNAKVEMVKAVKAGAFTPPNLKAGEQVPPSYKKVPAFCRITATLAPTADSEIHAEVWLPEAHWNRRFKGQGNGGFAGYIDYAGLAAAVTQQYASASTDTGHTRANPAWALGHPEKIKDYGYRSVHEMTVYAKNLIESFYGHSISHSYFASCSNGGRQALMEAQRYPADYDGILAGAPANNWTSLLSGGLDLLQKMDGDAYIPPEKISAISRAVIEECDASDGVQDGVLNDPRECHFNPEVLLCKGTESYSCLTTPQVGALKAIYSGTHDIDSHLILPGLLPGAEDGPGGWVHSLTGPHPDKSSGAGFVYGYLAIWSITIPTGIIRR